MTDPLKTQVEVDAKFLRSMLDRGGINLDAWADIAIEYMEHAEKIMIDQDATIKQKMSEIDSMCLYAKSMEEDVEKWKGAFGWFYAEACIQMEKGQDIREADFSDLVTQFERDHTKANDGSP